MTIPPDPDPTEDLAGPDKYDRDRDAGGSSFLEARWWRWVGLGAAALVVLSFTLPLLVPLFSGGDAPSSPSDGTTPTPDFVLPAAGGGTVRLSEETRRNDAVVLVFYRGYF